MAEGFIPETYPAEQATAIGPRRLSLTERLEAEKNVLNKRLNEVDEALALLKAYPELQRVIDVVFKVVR